MVLEERGSGERGRGELEWWKNITIILYNFLRLSGTIVHLA